MSGRRLALAAAVAAGCWPAATAAGGFVSPWPAVRCADTAQLLAAHADGVFHDDGDHTIDLRLRVCRRLGELQAGARLSDDRYEALQLLAHELSHAGGIADEAAADCHGTRIVVRVGRHLGLPAATIAAVARVRAGWLWRCSAR